MGQFGSFKINEDINHFVVGTTEGGPLTAGEYSPASREEFDALAHLASVSVQGPEDAQSHTLVDLLTNPDVVEVSAVEEGTSEPALAEPPPAPAAGAPAVPPAAPPAGNVPVVELFTFTGDPATVDLAAWPKADVETAAGEQLYTWAGPPPAPVSAEWVAYSGPTLAVPPAAPPAGKAS
jgi:hypothetical protein